MAPSFAQIQNNAHSDDETDNSSSAIIHANDMLKLGDVTFDAPSMKPDDGLAHCRRYYSFDVHTLAAAFHLNCSADAIRSYLSSYGQSVVKSGLGKLVNDHHHILTYAIHYNDVDILHMLLEHGLDPKARDFGNVPVLAYAIMLPHFKPCNTTELVKILLAYGASPRHIPRELRIDYIKTPTVTSDKSARGGNKWCSENLRKILVETMHLTIRYSLWRASRLENQHARMLQIAKAKGISPLLRIPFFIIAQETAVQQVVDEIFTHIAGDSESPLVLAFSGPSGIGKTQLASTMGDLISAKFLDIDCTQPTTVFSLLGTTAGYKESETGSPLNNFLIRNNGQRSVVFMDEFDKTTQEVREALLKVMDAGTYTGRPGNLQVNCTKTIWILATNKGDDVVADFFAQNIEKRKEEDVLQVDMTPLQMELQELLASEYSPAVCGRIDAFVPFLPFRFREQAVVAHKFMLSFQDRFRKPIDLKKPPSRLVGHSLLRVVDDGLLCQHLAKRGHTAELGARSLKRAVGTVEKKFMKEYSNRDEPVSEAGNQGPFEKYVAQLRQVTEEEEDVAVFSERKSEAA